jgi:hypothetical protein
LNFGNDFKKGNKERSSTRFGPVCRQRQGRENQYLLIVFSTGFTGLPAKAGPWLRRGAQVLKG